MKLLVAIAIAISALQFAVLTLAGYAWPVTLKWALLCGPGWLLAISVIGWALSRLGLISPDP